MNSANVVWVEPQYLGGIMMCHVISIPNEKRLSGQNGTDAAIGYFGLGPNGLDLLSSWIFQDIEISVPVYHSLYDVDEISKPHRLFLIAARSS